MQATIEEVKELIAPYIDTISDCLYQGFADFKSYKPEFNASYEIRTRANMIRDRTVIHLRQAYSFHEKVKVIENQGLFLLRIEDKVMIRINKLNDEFTIRDGNTKRRNLYLNQQQELFPEYKFEVTNLIAGYRVDKLWEHISFYISCPNGKIVSWVINFDDMTEAIDLDSFEIETMPMKMGRVKIKNELILGAVNETNS